MEQFNSAKCQRSQAVVVCAKKENRVYTNLLTLPERKPKDPPTAFIELVSSQPEVRLECVVEAERPGVGIVRVQLKAVTMREIAELSRALLSLS